MCKFTKPDEWEEAVRVINCIEAYQCICREMFNSDENTSARLHVLELFTRDVCKMHTTIAKDVYKYFLHVRELLENPYKKVKLYCWLCSKFHDSEMSHNIAHVLLSLL